MNARFFLTWLVVFVLWFIGTYVINAMILINEWIETVTIIRGWDEELKIYHFMVLPFVCWSFGAVWLYKNFTIRRPWVQRGLLYGLVLALVTIVPMRMMNYVTLQLPGKILVEETALFTIQLLILGLVIAWSYRQPESGDARA